MLLRRACPSLAKRAVRDGFLLQGVHTRLLCSQSSRFTDINADSWVRATIAVTSQHTLELLLPHMTEQRGTV